MWPLEIHSLTSITLNPGINFDKNLGKIIAGLPWCAKLKCSSEQVDFTLLKEGLSFYSTTLFEKEPTSWALQRSHYSLKITFISTPQPR